MSESSYILCIIRFIRTPVIYLLLYIISGRTDNLFSMENDFPRQCRAVVAGQWRNICRQCYTYRLGCRPNPDIMHSVYILLRITIVRNIVGLIVYKRQHYSCVRYCTAVVERNNYITSASLYQKPFSVQFVDVSTTICSGVGTLKCIYYYHPPHIARRLGKSLLMLSRNSRNVIPVLRA